MPTRLFARVYHFIISLVPGVVYARARRLPPPPLRYHATRYDENRIRSGAAVHKRVVKKLTSNGFFFLFLFGFRPLFSLFTLRSFHTELSTARFCSSHRRRVGFVDDKRKRCYYQRTLRKHGKCSQIVYVRFYDKYRFTVPKQSFRYTRGILTQNE